MTNISEIKIGSRYTLAARGNTPETTVKVIAVKGRWVKVAAEFNGAEMNVAANALTLITETSELAKNGIVDPARRAAYTVTKLGDGLVAVDNNDKVAQSLRGMELDDVVAIAAQILGVRPAELRAKYSHLNNGQIRMNLGNRIRKAVKTNPKLMSVLK